MPTDQTELPDVVIGSLLGRGSAGSVYVARVRSTGKVVAVKHLMAGSASPRTRLRFEREARILELLDHPGVVRVDECRDHAGEWFIIMEYVDGCTLSDVVDQVTPAGGVEIVAQVADALDVVHRAGIVHRDLKPANVLLTRDGVCKLADFGVARFVGDSRQGVGPDLIRTRTGTVLGTPAYMAPEVAAGERDVGSVADVYSLGVVAYRMFVGRLPFLGDAYEQLAAHVNEPVPPPSEIVPGFPPAVESVMLRALAKDPAARFLTAGGFADALTIAAAGWEPHSRGTRRELAAMVPERPAQPSPIPDGADTLTLAELLERPRSSLPSLPLAAVPVYAPAAVHRRQWLLVLVIALLGALVGVIAVLAAHHG